jgi:hypothetical protein
LALKGKTNMPTYKTLLAAAALLIGTTLAACNLSASTEPPPIDQSAAETRAAETIIAQLTDVAETLVPSETPGSPAEATPTAVIASPTEPTQPAAPTATVATESPTATATSTSPPPPTPTLDANDPKAGLGDPAFYEDFSSGESWPLYSDDHVSFSLDDSQLLMTAFNPDHYNGWMLTWPVIGDFYLEMTATTRACSGKDQYGSMIRAVKTEEGYVGYIYNISCDGNFSLRRWNGEKYIPLVDWTSSDAINSGANQTNRIGVLVDGNQFTFYINGEQVGQVQDDNHLEGRFGVSIGSVNTSDLEVLVDEIAYWDVP